MSASKYYFFKLAPRDQNAACFIEINTNYPVNDLFYVKSNSFSDCCQICGANPSCNAIAFDKTTFICYLKTAAPAAGAGNQQNDKNVDFGTLTIR